MAYANGDNIEAREHLMLGSLLAGVAFSNSDTTVVHSLSEGIGGLYDVPHGLANAIFLPFVMEYNISSTPERFIDIAKAMGCNISKLDVLDAAFQSVEAVKKLSGMLNIPGFKSLLIEKETFSMIARVAMLNSGTLSNPRKMSENDFVNILNNAYNAG
jgi:alcohol dehydrogenase